MSLLKPQSIIVTSLTMKAFTKSKNKPNLIAIKLTINSEYKKLVEQAWRCSSPSNYFKFKVDLLLNNSIKRIPDQKSSETSLAVKKLQRFPARYNFSQANHVFFHRFLNKDVINKHIMFIRFGGNFLK